MSHTKPGPNIPKAVAMNCFLKDSIEEKELDRRVCRESLIGLGVGDMVVKKW